MSQSQAEIAKVFSDYVTVCGQAYHAAVEQFRAAVLDGDFIRQAETKPGVIGYRRIRGGGGSEWIEAKLMETLEPGWTTEDEAKRVMPTEPPKAEQKLKVITVHPVGVNFKAEYRSTTSFDGAEAFYGNPEMAALKLITDHPSIFNIKIENRS